MWDNSETKKEINRVLMEWDYNDGKATAFSIAQKIGRSEANVSKILRYYKNNKIAEVSRGSWHLL
jgi:hypothetical protein